MFILTVKLCCLYAIYVLSKQRLSVLNFTTVLNNDRTTLSLNTDRTVIDSNYST